MTGNLDSWHTHLGLLENTVKTENVVRSALPLLCFQKISKWCLDVNPVPTLLANSEFLQGFYKAFKLRSLPKK